MEPQSHHKRIIYVGDSFAACMSTNHWKLNGQHPNQSYHVYGEPVPKFCHPSIVADHFDLELANFAYAGKSWWYARRKFIDAINRHDRYFLGDVFAVIFCHTDWNRLNSGKDFSLNWFHNYKVPKEFRKNEDVIAQELFYKHIHEPEFQHWAGQRWFHELAEMGESIPMIHFSCFPQTVDHMDILPGRKFTTPLIHVSIAELQGTDDDVFRAISINDNRANHLSDHNNQALAKTTIQALENYRPITTPIDLTGFHLRNPNAHNFPNPGYGTR